ncbi:MAG: DUF2244 domain-containing protein [Paracoccaceae bacterium]
MPYRWTPPITTDQQELCLWAHQSLPTRGMAAFILITFILILLPTFAVLGTPVLWGLLPFLMLAIWGIYTALQHNHRARQISEVLTLGEDMAHLIRTEPSGQVLEWQSNRYWTRVRKYEVGGPVPNYVTLKGDGREVEIGAFLAEEERLALFNELQDVLSRPTR